jgi:Family of unknown function (DUF6062)
MSLSAHDIVDVRLSDAMGSGGCPVCAVRVRSERAALDSIIAEHVLDIPFRADLERKRGFCRRHQRELILADRRESGGILGSSILYGAMLERRLELMRGIVGAKRRGRKTRLDLARKRPPCIACEQGASAVDVALGRLVQRAATPGWADAIADAPFCVDDLLALWAAAGDDASLEPVARRQLARLEDLGTRLAGFVDHSAHDRLHLRTDRETTAASDAAHALGGSNPQPDASTGRSGPVSR